MTTRDYLALSDQAMQRMEQADWEPHLFLSGAGAAPSVSPKGEGKRGEQGAWVEWHPLIPFLPKNTRVLFLGSFPPQQKRWCMDFFYPNYLNDHWRIEGEVFFGDAQYFVVPSERTFRLKAITAHLKRHGIGFFDTAIAIRRLAGNASDKFLEVVAATDIGEMIGHLPQLRAIVTTGEKATETISTALDLRDGRGRWLLPQVNSFVSTPFAGVELYRLPSSSRAYPMSLNRKAEAYRGMFERY